MGDHRPTSTGEIPPQPAADDGFAGGGERDFLRCPDWLPAAALLRDFPPFTTVQGHFYRWRDEGRWQAINHDPVMRARDAIGRNASPSAGAIDSQSVTSCEAGGPRGFNAGEKLTAALRVLGRWMIEIVRRSDAAKGFVLLPRRWVVEWTFAWLNRNRRLACPKGMRSIKDFEAVVTTAATWVMIASVKLIIRRLAKT